MDMKDALKLLLVDDSKILRKAIAAIFSDNENIKIEQAENGAEALEKLQWFDPDVVTLDINMPIMDGISTLKRMMIEHPVPTVMLSSLAQEGADVTFDALRFGAVDFISKPDALGDVSLDDQADEIRNRIFYAADVELAAIRYIRDTAAVAKIKKATDDDKCQFIVAIGAAEGGYGSLLKLIPYLSQHSAAAYLVSLYMEAEHVDEFVNYLNSYSQIEVRSAGHDEILQPGVCYICSGHNYMTVHNEGNDIKLHVSPAPFALRRGAIDMMMFSTVEVMGSQCAGVILSGLGEDGSEGMEEMIRMKGSAIVQDSKTCLYKEMAQNVIDQTDVDQIVADNLIADKIKKIVR